MLNLIRFATVSFIATAPVVAALWTTNARGEPATTTAVLSQPFMGKLCQRWNDSKLPTLLGRSGTEWIDSMDSKGKQIIVMSRRDCDSWKKVKLVIEADDAGNARCTSGGLLATGEKYQWKFEPTTVQWADFTDGFGMTDMPGIMDGFEGAYGTAMNNMGNFEIFFAVVGKLALDTEASWVCSGANNVEVAEEVAEIDLEDMLDILKG